MPPLKPLPMPWRPFSSPWSHLPPLTLFSPPNRQHLISFLHSTQHHPVLQYSHTQKAPSHLPGGLKDSCADLLPNKSVKICYSEKYLPPPLTTMSRMSFPALQTGAWPHPLFWQWNVSRCDTRGDFNYIHCMILAGLCCTCHSFALMRTYLLPYCLCPKRTDTWSQFEATPSPGTKWDQPSAWTKPQMALQIEHAFAIFQRALGNVFHCTVVSRAV